MSFIDLVKNVKEESRRKRGESRFERLAVRLRRDQVQRIRSFVDKNRSENGIEFYASDVVNALILKFMNEDGTIKE